MFLFRLVDEFEEDICFDNSSATGLMDKDPPVDGFGVAFECSIELLFVELTGVGTFDGNGGGDEWFE